jgi:peroxiredoxin
MQTNRTMAIVPWVLVAILGAALIFISTRHRKLREEFLEHRRTDDRASIGQFVPAFTSTAVNSAQVSVGEPKGNNRQLLILLTSTCPFCRQTLPTWKAVARRVDSVPSHSIEMIALTTDSARLAANYSATNALPFPLVVFPSRRLMATYHAFRVPQTILVDSSGRVMYARSGVLTPPAVDSLWAAATAKPAIRRARASSSTPTPVAR